MVTLKYQLQGEKEALVNFRNSGDAEEFIKALKASSVGDRVVKCEEVPSK